MLFFKRGIVENQMKVGLTSIATAQLCNESTHIYIACVCHFICHSLYFSLIFVKAVIMRFYYENFSVNSVVCNIESTMLSRLLQCLHKNISYGTFNALR